MAKKVDPWASVEEGTPVVAKLNGAEMLGRFLHACGGKDKGKLRIAIDGDDSKYREIPADDVSLADRERPKLVEVKPNGSVVVCPDFLEKYNAAVQKVRAFADACSGYATREELKRLADSL